MCPEPLFILSLYLSIHYLFKFRLFKFQGIVYMRLSYLDQGKTRKQSLQSKIRHVLLNV